MLFSWNKANRYHQRSMMLDQPVANLSRENSRPSLEISEICLLKVEKFRVHKADDCINDQRN